MIDLNKLQEKFDVLFEQETEESFNIWLEDKKKKEIMAYLGAGEIEEMRIKHPVLPEGLLTMPVKVYFEDAKNDTSGNTQYALAA